MFHPDRKYLLIVKEVKGVAVLYRKEFKGSVMNRVIHRLRLYE